MGTENLFRDQTHFSMKAKVVNTSIVKTETVKPRTTLHVKDELHTKKEHFCFPLKRWVEAERRYKKDELCA